MEGERLVCGQFDPLKHPQPCCVGHRALLRRVLCTGALGEVGSRQGSQPFSVSIFLSDGESQRYVMLRLG